MYKFGGADVTSRLEQLAEALEKLDKPSSFDSSLFLEKSDDGEGILASKFAELVSYLSKAFAADTESDPDTTSDQDESITAKIFPVFTCHLAKLIFKTIADVEEEEDDDDDLMFSIALPKKAPLPPLIQVLKLFFSELDDITFDDKSLDNEITRLAKVDNPKNEAINHPALKTFFDHFTHINIKLTEIKERIQKENEAEKDNDYDDTSDFPLTRHSAPTPHETSKEIPITPPTLRKHGSSWTPGMHSGAGVTYPPSSLQSGFAFEEVPFTPGVHIRKNPFGGV